MDELVYKAVDAVLSGAAAYCKFLSANDSGETGGHQSGILISMSAKSILFTDQELRDNHILKKTGS
ncbi:MAG: restriction endonuclease, partial [Clostridiales bacterium]|nr:restriction endonuclease [Clostridiales bacterium]